MTNTPKALWALGLMSGTSLDGIDAALVRTDGDQVLDIGPALTIPYDEPFRQAVRSIFGTRPQDRSPQLDDVEADLTRRHAQAVDALLAHTDIRPDVIGFHGQTLFHAPGDGITFQMGDGDLLARLTGVPVVFDFRSNDVAHGGQGAPLVPAWHGALARSLPESLAARPLGILNLGGVGNLTWIGSNPDGPPIAFDTGPGNALIDDWMLSRCGLSYDFDGQLAGSGFVDGGALARLLRHPYFQHPPPKSLDRDTFCGPLPPALSNADGAATLTAFTVISVVLALTWLPDPPTRWLVCGGGRKNKTLMDGLRTALRVPVDPVEAVGWNGDALEAQAFAYLAVRSLEGLPLSWPTTTGGGAPVTGGRLALGDRDGSGLFLDTSRPDFREECTRQSALLKGDPQENEILDFIDAVMDDDPRG